MTSYPTFRIVLTDGKKLGEITDYKRKQLSLISWYDGIKQPNACTSSIHFYGLDI